MGQTSMTGSAPAVVSPWNENTYPGYSIRAATEGKRCVPGAVRIETASLSDARIHTASAEGDGDPLVQALKESRHLL